MEKNVLTFLGTCHLKTTSGNESEKDLKGSIYTYPMSLKNMEEDHNDTI